MELNRPAGVAIDKSNILYVSTFDDDGELHRIDLKTGLMTILETQVSTSGIGSMLIDSSGNVIAAIPTQCRVVRINVADGSVHAIVGAQQDGAIRSSCGSDGENGPALKASVEPDFLSQDTAGNLFIVDSPHARVWRLDRQSGVISSIAGAPRLRNPTAVAINTQERVLISQVVRNARRRAILSLDPSTGLLTPLDKASFAGNNGIWANSTGRRRLFSDRLGNFYMCDEARVFYIDISKRFVSLVAEPKPGFSGDGGPATKAQLYWPASLVLDSADNIYIADSENQRVRRIDTKTHIITTVAGNGLPRHIPGTIELGGDTDIRYRSPRQRHAHE